MRARRGSAARDAERSGGGHAGAGARARRYGFGVPPIELNPEVPHSAR